MDKKEEKKGFWASLFAPKSYCCCGPQIEEIKEEKKEEKSKTEEDKEENNDNSCGCGCC